MSRTRLMQVSLLCAFAVFASVAMAAPIAENPPTPALGSVLHTTLQPDLTLKSSLSSEFFPTTAFHQKTCRCSCGFVCNQDDDCGPGGKCEQFISCCARPDTSQLLPQTAGKSTRSGEAVVVTGTQNCK
jgi:hypothetical protein